MNRRDFIGGVRREAPKMPDLYHELERIARERLDVLDDVRFVKVDGSKPHRVDIRTPLPKFH